MSGHVLGWQTVKCTYIMYVLGGAIAFHNLFYVFTTIIYDKFQITCMVLVLGLSYTRWKNWKYNDPRLRIVYTNITYIYFRRFVRNKMLDIPTYRHVLIFSN